MTRRIISYVLTALLLVAFFSITLTIQATTTMVGKRQETRIRELLEIVYHAYLELGPSFIDSFETEDYNITLLSPEGEIVNSDFEKSWLILEDQSSITEFLSSIESNPKTIISTNTSFLFGNLVLAGISTEDGMVLIASTSLRTFSDTFSDMRLELLYILLVSILLSSLLARLISYLIVQPLNQIDVDSPQSVNDKRYKELAPLINKIAEQKVNIAEQERLLDEEKSRFRAISETLVEGMILIEDDNTISYINESAVKILSLPSSPEGQPYSIVFPSSLKEIVDKTILEEGQRATIYHGKRAYQTETARLSLPDGRCKGVSILLYDVTEHMELEKDRRDFTANVSHELKTPLHIIAGSAELLELGLVKEEDRKTFIHQIYSETERMSVLIDDIIKLSRLDDTALTIEKETLDVKKETASVIENLKSIAESKKIDLLLKGDDIIIKCNKAMFGQIIYNLVDNAVKYSDEGGRVTIVTKREGETAVIDISDTGIGIPEEYHTKIFERFFRVDKSRSKEVGGTGLGLAIVKNSCLENGGDVKVLSSAEGEGTTFRITFPGVD